MLKDPIVEEVRKVRRDIEEECEGSFERIFAEAIEIQRRYAGKLVSRPLHLPEEREVAPGLNHS